MISDEFRSLSTEWDKLASGLIEQNRRLSASNEVLVAEVAALARNGPEWAEWARDTLQRAYEAEKSDG